MCSASVVTLTHWGWQVFLMGLVASNQGEDHFGGFVSRPLHAYVQIAEN